MELYERDEYVGNNFEILIFIWSLKSHCFNQFHSNIR